MRRPVICKNRKSRFLHVLCVCTFQNAATNPSAFEEFPLLSLKLLNSRLDKFEQNIFFFFFNHMNVNFVSQHSAKTHIKCVIQRCSGTDERGRFSLPAGEPSTLKTDCTLRFCFSSSSAASPCTAVFLFVGADVVVAPWDKALYQSLHNAFCESVQTWREAVIWLQ